jgi:hypothetical protein
LLAGQPLGGGRQGVNHGSISQGASTLEKVSFLVHYFLIALVRAGSQAPCGPRQMPAPRKRRQRPGDPAALTDDQTIGERDEAARSLVSRERSEDGDSVVAGKNRKAQTWPVLKDGVRIAVGLADRSPDGRA